MTRHACMRSHSAPRWRSLYPQSTCAGRLDSASSGTALAVTSEPCRREVRLNADIRSRASCTRRIRIRMSLVASRLSSIGAPSRASLCCSARILAGCASRPGIRRRPQRERRGDRTRPRRAWGMRLPALSRPTRQERHPCRCRRRATRSRRACGSPTPPNGRSTCSTTSGTTTRPALCSSKLAWRRGARRAGAPAARRPQHRGARPDASRRSTRIRTSRCGSTTRSCSASARLSTS